MPEIEEGERQRPTAVTVIGRVWLIAAIFLFLVAVVDIIVWTALRPAMPTLLSYASRRDPRLHLLAPYLQYYVAAKSIEAVFAAAAGISAYHFLRLRSWARAAVEAASWIYLLYLCGLVYFSYRIWRHLSLDPNFAAERPGGVQRLVGGIAVEVLVAAGLLTMIALLRGRKLRSAFEPAGPDA